MNAPLYDPDRAYAPRFGWIRGWDGEPMRGCLICDTESVEEDGEERCTCDDAECEGRAA